MALQGDLPVNLAAMPVKIRAAMHAFGAYASPQVQDYARTNAPWTDQTGNARQGLKTNYKTTLTRVEIILSHSVPYGIWLEVRWSGKYGIILDTIQVMGRRLMPQLSQVLDDLS